MIWSSLGTNSLVKEQLTVIAKRILCLIKTYKEREIGHLEPHSTFSDLSKAFLKPCWPHSQLRPGKITIVVKFCLSVARKLPGQFQEIT